jgi:hypothetical protein
VLIELTGCASFRAPVTDDEWDEKIRDWDLSSPNPWFFYDGYLNNL